METSLHRQLKARYAEDDQTEVPLGPYRIDAIAGNLLIEIQHGSLAAIRDKIRALVEDHDVLVVKPIVATKQLVKRRRKGGKSVTRRKSPKRGALIDLFEDLVYFTSVFPHPRLTVEAVEVDVEEWRYPGHGRRRRHRKSDFIVEDQKLVDVHRTCRVSDAEDLWRLLPPVDLPRKFHTGHLAEQINQPRRVAQRIAYVLRHARAIRQVGKEGNTLLYARKHPRRKAAA